MAYLNLVSRAPDGNSCVYAVAFDPPRTVRALPRSDGRYAISVVRRSAIEIAAQGHPDKPWSALVVGVSRGAGQQPSFGATEAEAAQRCARGLVGGDP